MSQEDASKKNSGLRNPMLTKQIRKLPVELRRRVDRLAAKIILDNMVAKYKYALIKDGKVYEVFTSRDRARHSKSFHRKFVGGRMQIVKIKLRVI
jgi:hypothetical protein